MCCCLVVAAADDDDAVPSPELSVDSRDTRRLGRPVPCPARLAAPDETADALLEESLPAGVEATDATAEAPVW